MLLEEVVSAFLYSRRHGIRESGAKRKSTPTTLINYDAQLRPFIAFVQSRNKHEWDAVSREDVRGYIEWVGRKENWSEATKLSHLRTLRTLMKFIEKDDECREAELRTFVKLMPAIPRNPPRKQIPSPVDLRRWRDAVKPKGKLGLRNYVAFSLWLETGLRSEELCGLRLDWLALDDSRIYIIGKTGPRNVPITDRMVRMLKTWLKKRSTMVHAKESPYVFVGRRGERLTPNGFGQTFRKMRAANPKLSRLSPQLIRHFFGTYYMKNGGELERLRLMLGHTTYYATQNYLHLAQVTGTEAKDELERVSPLQMVERTRVVE
jgi:site-specific recombinase XerD